MKTVGFRVASAALACTVFACTWTRFDDVTDNPPVERLDAPNDDANAGRALATFHDRAGNVTLVVSADTKLLEFELGSGVNPSRTASAEQPCAGDAYCVQTQQLAGLAASPMTGNLGCVAYGLGLSDEGAPSSAANVLLICEGKTMRSLPTPEAFTAWLSGHTVSPSTVVSMATTSRQDATPLVVSVPEAGIAWFYDGIDSAPIELPTLPAGDVAGPSLAVIRDGASNWVAASSEIPSQTLWLYRVNADRTASLATCVEGPPQFGRLLATGNFDGDALDDLAVADDQRVVVLKGTSLATTAANSTSSDVVCAPLDSLARIGYAECTQLPDLNGCAGAPYPMSLASGNLDAVGPDELIVGAPNTSVRGESSAGAAFIYATGSDALRIVQGLYVSATSSGTWLGKSVAVAQLGGIDTVLAGAPGSNTVMAFYCNSLMPPESKSARCH